jgi:NAD(P)-dependent dehydrogenase (short-subunit alcohol dehydrogenase family)
LLPLLEAAASPEDPARIIMVGSVDGLNVNRMPTFSYGPSKAAIHHLARTLALHVANRNITVNAIAPGLFPSNMTKATIDAMGEQIRMGTPLKRHGKPEDMAGVAIYLAAKAASFVTGVVIPVDGGITGAKPTL